MVRETSSLVRRGGPDALRFSARKQVRSHKIWRATTGPKKPTTPCLLRARIAPTELRANHRRRRSDLSRVFSQSCVCFALRKLFICLCVRENRAAHFLHDDVNFPLRPSSRIFSSFPHKLGFLPRHAIFISLPLVIMCLAVLNFPASFVTPYLILSLLRHAFSSPYVSP